MLKQGNRRPISISQRQTLKIITNKRWRKGLYPVTSSPEIIEEARAGIVNTNMQPDDPELHEIDDAIFAAIHQRLIASAGEVVRHGLPPGEPLGDVPTIDGTALTNAILASISRLGAVR